LPFSSLSLLCFHPSAFILYKEADVATPQRGKRTAKKKIAMEGVDAQARPRTKPEKPGAPYDPLAGRMRLMAALWNEFEEWSQRAKEAETPAPYVIKILQMLPQSMQECDDLLERLRLLSPGMCGPEVKVDLSLCRSTPQETTRLPVFFERMRKKLEESAMPIVSAKLPNETELLSQSDPNGAGSPIDVEFCQRGEAGKDSDGTS